MRHNDSLEAYSGQKDRRCWKDQRIAGAPIGRFVVTLVTLLSRGESDTINKDSFDDDGCAHSEGSAAQYAAAG